jgi:hypothetical protein
MGQSLKDLAVEIALAEARHGVYENANDNRGERIDEYSNFANQTVGEKWCAKFIFWCFAEAANRLAMRSPMPNIFGCEELENWARAYGKLAVSPMRGDVLIKAHHHTGLVTGPAVGKTFPSVEGNTWANTDMAHRKEGVYILNKELVSNCTFIRL